MGRWSWIAALALAVLAYQPAAAFQIPADDLLEVERPKPAKLLGFHAPSSPMHYLELIQSPEIWEVRESELIRDEQLNLLNAFAASSEATLPVISAQTYIIHSTRVSQMKKRPVTELDEWEELAKRRRIIPGMAWIMTPATSERVPVSERNLETTGGWNSFMSFLTEEDGLFSGRPWDWDNFLPRLLTAIGLILGLLVTVEFVHIMMAVGLRGIGGKQRRSRSH